MTRWEYEIENLVIVRMTEGLEYANVLKKVLNARGKKGWELVSLAGPSDAAGSVAVFKRPLTEFEKPQI